MVADDVDEAAPRRLRVAHPTGQEVGFPADELRDRRIGMIAKAARHRLERRNGAHENHTLRIDVGAGDVEPLLRDIATEDDLIDLHCHNDLRLF